MTHLIFVVVGDGEARGVLGLGPLAERGEHAPHEPALVPAEVEPGDGRGGGGREERRGEEDGGAARHRRRRRHRGVLLLPAGWLVGSVGVGVGVWRLAALRCACPRARFASDGVAVGGWGLWGKRVVGAGWRGADSDA